MSRLEALRAGGKPALSRALTGLERAPEAAETLDLLRAAWAAQDGVAVGFTGPPGVGKSTLIGALIKRLRERGRRVAALAVDPSSRRSGGALLGDRARFAADPEDDGLFVRSLAARDRLGGLAESAWPAIVLLRALYDLVLVETVGVGQSETDVAEAADHVVFCAQPGAGDALQFMKAGIIEVPDQVVVAKADLGASAERAAAELRSALSLAAAAPAPPVSLCSAADGTGLAALAEALEALEAAQPRRAAQGRSWAARALCEAFGAEGLALARRESSWRDAAVDPFGLVNGMRERLREALIVGWAPRSRA